MVTMASMDEKKIALIKRIVVELADAGESPKDTADMAMYIFGATMAAAQMNAKDVSQYVVRIVGGLKVKQEDLGIELQVMDRTWREFEAWHILYKEEWYQKVHIEGSEKMG